MGRQVIERTMQQMLNGARRIPPRCRHFGLCGGCYMQDVPYEDQVRAKGALVAELVRRCEGLEQTQIMPALAMDDPWQYRNKAEMTFGSSADGVILGFAPRGRFYEVVEITECPISSDRTLAVARAAQDFARKHALSAYDSRTHEGLLRHLVVRESRNTGDLLVNLVAASPEWPREEFAAAMQPFHPSGVIWTLNTQLSQAVKFDGIEVLVGTEKMRESALDVTFTFSPQCFFQTNTTMAATLFQTAVEAAAANATRRVLDAYCGVGTLGILLAREAAGVVGVEAVEPAVEDARFNAERNGVENAEFICGKVEKYDWEPGRFEIALVDPPRAGCHAKFINRLVEKGPAKIVYISCNPLTMAADLARLQERYRAEWVQPIDMFPHTVHVESVALLKAKQ